MLERFRAFDSLTVYAPLGAHQQLAVHVDVHRHPGTAGCHHPGSFDAGDGPQHAAGPGEFETRIEGSVAPTSFGECAVLRHQRGEAAGDGFQVWRSGALGPQLFPLGHQHAGPAEAWVSPDAADHLKAGSLNGACVDHDHRRIELLCPGDTPFTHFCDGDEGTATAQRVGELVGPAGVVVHDHDAQIRENALGAAFGDLVPQLHAPAGGFEEFVSERFGVGDQGAELVYEGIDGIGDISPGAEDQPQGCGIRSFLLDAQDAGAELAGDQGAEFVQCGFAQFTGGLPRPFGNLHAEFGDAFCDGVGAGAPLDDRHGAAPESPEPLVQRCILQQEGHRRYRRDRVCGQ